MTPHLQVAFDAIKQLAVLLRNALQQKTKDAFKDVYCWQVSAGTPAAGIHPCCWYQQLLWSWQQADGMPRVDSLP